MRFTTSRIYDLSVIAPNGHWYTQAPQAMHLSASTTRAGLGLRETNTQSPRVMSTETPS